MPAFVPKTSRQRRNLHGRRQGRPLRPAQRRLIEETLPALAIDLPCQAGGLDPAALFDDSVEEIWLEVGFGGGEHLAWQAARVSQTQRPVGLLGAEFFVNGIASLLRHIAATPAERCVRIFRGDVRDLLEALSPDCLDRVFVLFPDPWPKLRHHKRRIIQSQTLDRLAVLMRPGAELRVATDDPTYLRWILEQLLRHPAFDWTARGPQDWRRRPDDWPPTRYEQKALAAGRRPAYLVFSRRAG